ncbi:MAG: serine hydrolase domain-containing protein [Novosphingobium sp.]
MSSRGAAFILSLLVLPVLSGCGRADIAEVPASPAGLAAVVAKPGVSREKLARAVDRLFDDPEAGETRALIVQRAGQIVAERYAPGFTAQTRFLGWSMSKCVTAAFTGLLVADGMLRLDEPAPIRTWQRPGDARGEVTLRQLLQMRSGLRHREEAEPRYEADTVRMLFLDGRDDMAAYAEAQPLEAEPGTMWKYSSATSVILADAAATVLTPSRDPALRRRLVADYLRTRLFEPIGMLSAQPEFDAAGTLIGGSMIHANARDWAKFGEFLRSGGAVAGAQVLPTGWVDFMTAPSPQNPGYGAQVWLNRPQPSGNEELFPGQAPADLFACIGHQGQYILVSPSQRLTVVRLGKTDSDQRPALRRKLAGLVGLFPIRK